MFEGWQHYRNILCIRPDNMGDVLMTEPALRALKEAVPGRKLTLLTSSAGAAVARLLPVVDDIITFDVPWAKHEAAWDGTAVAAMAGQLRERRYDVAVIFTAYSQNPLPAAMLCFMAGMPHALGYCRENPYGLMDCWVPDPEPLDTIRHEVDRQLALVATTGARTEDTAMHLPVPEQPGQEIRRRLQAEVPSGGRWLVLHPGVSEAKRRYPPGHYAEAMRTLVADGFTVVMTGAATEKAQVDELAQAIGTGVVNLAGQLSVSELAALLAEAPLLVANNTGPVHIAAAVGTPVVVLYAMTNPQHTPWQVPHSVLYFPVEPELRSKNRFLQTFPGAGEPAASPAAIVKAVHGLIDAPREASS
ncbi:glycosyltransferase family 9 protein [Candidatus Saccharibacteria bacterium]|nr:glycosyltransferase family 9 protein [Candidatus Saccharibacteria bacterium]